MKTNNKQHNRLADKVVTVEDIMAGKPCPRYPEERVRELIGDGKTLQEIVDLPIRTDDILWVFRRPGIVPESVQHEFALRCAEAVLPIWEQQYPDDDRPRKAIETKRRWMLGEATEYELTAARSAVDTAIHMSRKKAEEGEDDRFDYRSSEAALAAWYASSTYIVSVVRAYTCMERAAESPQGARMMQIKILREILAGVES